MKTLTFAFLLLVSGWACAADAQTAAVTNAAALPVSTNAATKAVSTNAVKKASRPAKITAAKTYYDRKEGFAFFSGSVHVDDERYQLHAEKAYVFMDGTNELKRIVALGNVAVTNENKRAYGTKASYYRNHGLVVLSGDAELPAEVRDAAKDGDRVVRGSKIKFWVDSEQVEVVDAVITAPSQGKGLTPATLIGK